MDNNALTVVKQTRTDRTRTGFNCQIL